MRLDIQHPLDGARVGESACGLFVTGRAHAGSLQPYDVALVIDTSRSTSDPSGSDINGNGIVGRPRLGHSGAVFASGSTDPGDSVLSAEVETARQLMQSLDPLSARVALVTFSGQPPKSGRAWFVWTASPEPATTHVRLTSDRDRVERALDLIASAEPSGGTHTAAGLDLAIDELVARNDPRSPSEPDTEKVILFFTDGPPTLPFGPDREADNTRDVLRALSRAIRAQIRIHVFAIGPTALDSPVASVAMALRTDGYFIPVRHPGDIVELAREVRFAEIDRIELDNASTGQTAVLFRATLDGTWSGFVPMLPGANQIEVRAFASDGTHSEKSFSVHLDREASPVVVPREHVLQYNRVLEDCLLEAKRERLSAEKERARRVRKALVVEMERERARAFDRSSEQLKQLEIEEDE